MVASVPVKNFLQNRRDRAVGAILGHGERTLKTRMSETEWQLHRRTVMEAVNGYHDAVLDLMKAEDGVVRNDHLIEVLERVASKLENA